MTETPWTYHEFHHSPRRKTYSVMEGIKPIATCKHEKDARLIVSMKETNAELLEALKQIVDMAPCDEEGKLVGWGELCCEYDTCNNMHKIACKAIRKANGG